MALKKTEPKAESTQPEKQETAANNTGSKTAKKFTLPKLTEQDQVRIQRFEMNNIPYCKGCGYKLRVDSEGEPLCPVSNPECDGEGVK